MNLGKDIPMAKNATTESLLQNEIYRLSTENAAMRIMLKTAAGWLFNLGETVAAHECMRLVEKRTPTSGV